jgi:HK97 family phage prohead protease
MRAAGSPDRLQFTGYASVTEVPYTITDWLGDYTEIMRGGAFERTLRGSPDVIFCYNHDWDAVPLARTGAGTLTLAEDGTGLDTAASLDAARPDVATLNSAMADGVVTSMSFAFRVTEQTWSPDYDQRDILEVDLNGGDVSAVTWPANPATTGTTAMRAQARSLVASGALDVLGARIRSETRGDSALSPDTAAAVRAVLDLLAAADIHLDAAQPLLAGVLGVPNPDDDESQETAPDDEPTEGESLSALAGDFEARRLLATDPAVRRTA